MTHGGPGFLAFGTIVSLILAWLGWTTLTKFFLRNVTDATP